MRQYQLILFPLIVAAACGGSDGSTGGTGPGGNPSPNAYSLSADSTVIQRTATVGTALPTPVTVELAGKPAANVTVSWFPAVGSGSVSSKTSVTDANGVASVTWTLSDTAHVNTLTATAGTGSVNVTATGTAGAATGIAKASPDSTRLVAGASTLLSVRATDAFGNLVAGVPVTWAASGGALDLSSSTTGSFGMANVVFMTSSTPASYTITANAGALGSVTFTVVGF